MPKQPPSPRSLSPGDASHLEIRLGVSTRAPRIAKGRVAPVPETLIVERWRRLGSRRRDGSTYHGCRLPPSLWRIVDALLTRCPALLAMSVDEVDAQLRAVRVERKSAGTHLGSLPAQTLLTLLRFLARRDRLSRILEAHREVPRHGVTDLLLYRMREGRAVDFRFVEVKQATERVSAAQVAEIGLLRSLGLQAGILRLRGTQVASPRTRTRPARDTDILPPDVVEMIEQSVDEQMAHWARGLLLVMDGDVRTFTEDEVQEIIGRPAPKTRRARRRRPD